MTGKKSIVAGEFKILLVVMTGITSKFISRPGWVVLVAAVSRLIINLLYWNFLSEITRNKLLSGGKSLTWTPKR